MGHNKLFSLTRKFFFEVLSPKFNVSKLKRLMNFLYILFEKVAYHFEIFYSNYLQLYDELLEKEIKLAKINSKDKVLVIGSGALPATCILIAKKTNAKVHGIDIDPVATKKSTNFVKNLNLNNLIDFELADGINYDYSNYDVIFVLYGIIQHQNLLVNLSNKIQENSRVIYRTSEDVKEKIIGTNKILSDYFRIEDSFKSENIYLNRSYLLTKKK